MRAAILREPGHALDIEDVDLAPAGSGEVVVRIEAAGVCHTDYHYMQGDMICPLPVVLGHEGAGIVEELGPDVSGRVQVGDRVVLMWRPRCGQCPACIGGSPVMCELGRLQASTGGLLDGTSRLSLSGDPIHHFLGVSCFAERVVVSERSVVAIPPEVPAEVAAIAGCAVITGIGAVLNVVADGTGRPLLVLGAGGVGLSAVMGAALVGAHPVIAVDVDPAKLALARKVGATHTINASAGDPVEQVLSLTPSGVPWAIEAVGRATTLEQSLACLAPGGTSIAVGLTKVGATFAVPINDLVQRQKHVRGSLYGSANPLLDMPRILDLYLAGSLALDELLGERVPLDQVNEAFDRLATSPGRTVLVP
jgi:Zn-dependent alcohol dehydrogenase